MRSNKNIIITSAPAGKLMNIAHSTVLVVLVILHWSHDIMCTEDEIHCLSHDDITASTMDALKASGCSMEDACVVSSLNISSGDVSQQQHVNTNRDVRMHDCLVFVNSKMSSIPKSIFSQSSNISRLFVNNVQLSEIQKDSILYGKSLITVNLAKNLIREILLTIFYDLSNLKELNLAENKLEKIASNAFDKLTSLETLDLSRNQLVNIPHQLFQNLNKLTDLNMRHNRLQLNFGIFPEFVKTLDLSHNNIDIHFKFKIFSFLENLETLLLHGNRIENIHPSLFTLEHLRYLGISDNLFSCNMLADIFVTMKEKHVESVLERNVRNMSNIRGVRCHE